MKHLTIFLFEKLLKLFKIHYFDQRLKSTENSRMFLLFSSSLLLISPKSFKRSHIRLLSYTRTIYTPHKSVVLQHPSIDHLRTLKPFSSHLFAVAENYSKIL